MVVTHVSAWLMSLFGGLFSGALLVVAVERVNLWRRMPADQYVVDFRRSLYRLDPLIPILGGLSAAAAVVYALGINGLPAMLSWIGVALIIAIIVGSIAFAEPMNSQFRRLPEGEVPKDVDRLRTTWRRFHFARTVLALGALACLTAAVA